MFKYILRPAEKSLYVNLPDKLKFGFEFLTSVCNLLDKTIKTPCNHVYVGCNPTSNYDNLSKAYLYNVLKYISLRKKVYWNSDLKAIITSSIRSKKGTNFTPIIDLSKVITSKELNLYRFEGDVGIDKPIGYLSRILVEQNITSNPTHIKEFLSTTIGEIFSNSINHSDQDITYFMFDIVYENPCFMLYVNIIDYGKTIVENVRTYFQENIHKHISSKGCISWAIQSGNTTRNSSGGYGLPTLIDYIKAVDGELFIFSGNAYYCLENGQNKTGEFSNCHFYGTSVTFKVELLKTTNALVFDPVDNCLTSISLENI